MVYIKDWPEFQQRCVALYQKSPEKTRYLVKARPSTNSLILKVTDNVTTLKFRTRSSVILGRFEVFNKAMMLAMAGHKDPLTEAQPLQTQPATADSIRPDVQSQSQTHQQQPPSLSATQSAAASGGGGKKKKKKGKK